MSKYNDTKEGLTESQLKEREISDNEANFVFREIITTIKVILIVSIFIILGLLINAII